MAFQPSDIVLVTGANGHVAQHVVDQLLAMANGPKVRATVRSETSALQLESFFSKEITSARFSVVRILDIITPGIFDGAMQDVTHIAHIASPLVIGAQDIEKDLLLPAIHGTTNILSAALKVPTVKSVVITSSFASVADVAYGKRPGYTYSPTDWNPITYAEAADPNLDLTRWPEEYRPFITYMASKKLAESAAWELYNHEKPQWALSILLPTYIGGPYILPLSKGPDSLSWSDGLIWSVAAGKPLPQADYPSWVDVRDVARAHVQALITKEAKGKRFLLASTNLWYSDIADIVRNNFPELNPSTEKQGAKHWYVDTSDCKILGIHDWIPIEKTIVDTVQQVLDSQK
ncbi:NAD(P)-binding protein [Glonium stellatum]|uniref:NAD(P)-binding protein n=1 Tax=Glonium stellatum TaxID=574774 RepID=A0A8E2JWE1_9PEZI|nr:NAD(P)-binding protein [Glonium stellatum]